MFTPREGDGPSRWWLWVFIGPDTTCFVMDPTRAGWCWPATPASTPEPASWPSPASRFYAVYTSAGSKADGLLNLYSWAHVRRYFVRAWDANPAQLRYWTATWLERIKKPVRRAR